MELWEHGKPLSRLWVTPLTIRVGDAKVRMDGIAGVFTDEEHRNKGYARRILEATIPWMASRDATLTSLYGIPNFYPKFGYVPAGPDNLFFLRRSPVYLSRKAGMHGPSNQKTSGKYSASTPGTLRGW